MTDTLPPPLWKIKKNDRPIECSKRYSIKRMCWSPASAIQFHLHYLGFEMKDAMMVWEDVRSEDVMRFTIRHNGTGAHLFHGMVVHSKNYYQVITCR